jgi:hypothetical protein
MAAYAAAKKAAASSLLFGISNLDLGLVVPAPV